MDKRFIIVEAVNDHTVQAVFESAFVTPENRIQIGQLLSNHWFTSSQAFPSPRFDVIMGTANSYGTLKECLPNLRGWPGSPSRLGRSR